MGGTVCSLIAHLVLGGAVGFLLGMLVGQPLIGAGLVGLIALGEFASGYNKKERAFEETKKTIMLKHQTGVPLNPQEQALWEAMTKTN